MIQTVSTLSNKITTERVQKNKLKGTALEKMGKDILNNIKRDVQKEKTIKIILEEYVKKNPAYVVKQGFYDKDKFYEKHTVLTLKEAETIKLNIPNEIFNVMIEQINLHKRIDFVYYDIENNFLIF